MALSRREKQKIADLRKRQSSSLVFRGGKKLTGAEMTQRRAGIERDIRGIESRAGVAPRPSPRRSSVSSVSDTNINDLIVSNLGQQSGLRDTRPIIDRAPIVRSPLPPINMPFAAPRFNGVGLADRNYSAPAPRPRLQDFNSRIPSIFSQYVPGGDVVYKQGFAQRSDELSPSLMDTLRANTGAFTDNIRLPGGLEIRRNAPRYNAPSVTPNPYVSGQQTFTPPDTKFGFDFSLPTKTPMATETPMTTDGRSFSSPYGTQRGIGLGTVGGFGRGLFDELASSGAGYFPRQEPIFRVGLGSFGDNFTIPFTKGKTANDILREKASELSASFPNVTGYVGGLLDKIPFSTGNLGSQNIMIKPRGAEYDIYGNPIRQISPQEIERTYGEQIGKAMGKGRTYEFI
jgi:hypothetical protein